LFVDENPGIEISYLMPHNISTVFEAEEKPTFQWMMRKWGSCSRTCGKGLWKKAFPVLAICFRFYGVGSRLSQTQISKKASET